MHQGFDPLWFAIAIAIGCGFIFCQLMRPKTLLFGLGAILFMYTIGLPVEFNGRAIVQWINPLQGNRSAVIAGLVPTLLVGARLTLPPSKHVSIPRPLIFLILLYIYMGLVRIIHEGPLDGVLTMLLGLLTLTTVWVIVQRMSWTWSDFLIFPRVIVIALGGFLAATALQFVISPDSVLMGNTERFVGVAANPQFVGAMCGMGMLMLTWLAMYDNRRLMWIYLAMMVPTGVALLATGSRTGSLMFLLGICVLGVRRFGRQLLLLPLLGLGLLLVMQVAGVMGLELPLDRFLSGGNTRSGAWLRLIYEFRGSPLIGVGTGQAELSENSFLLAAAAYGIIAPALLIGLGLSCLAMGVSLHRRTQDYPSLQPQANLINATFAAYFAGSVFEGYIVGRISAMFVLITLAVVTGQLLLDRIVTWEAEEPVEEDTFDELPEQAEAAGSQPA